MVTTLDKNTALVVIDLQNGIAQFPVAHPITDIIANSAKLIEAFHKAGLPVVAVNVDPTKSKAFALRIEQKNPAMPQLPKEWFQIVKELGTTGEDIYVTKTTWGAFGSTNLHQKLQQLGVTGIVLCGVATSIGVDTTAREANALLYNVTFISDAMTDMHMDAHEHSFNRIFPRLGEIGNTEEILKLLGNNIVVGTKSENI
jgi:nicotinamidase-related amidase